MYKHRGGGGAQWVEFFTFTPLYRRGDRLGLERREIYNIFVHMTDYMNTFLAALSQF